MPEYQATVFVQRKGRRFSVIGETFARSKTEAGLNLLAAIPNAVSVKGITIKGGANVVDKANS